MSAMPQLSAESALGVNSANYRSIGAWAQWHNWAQYQPWAQFRELSQYWRLSAMPQSSAVLAPGRNAANYRSMAACCSSRACSWEIAASSWSHSSSSTADIAILEAAQSEGNFKGGLDTGTLSESTSLKLQREARYKFETPEGDFSAHTQEVNDTILIHIRPDIV